MVVAILLQLYTEWQDLFPCRKLTTKPHAGSAHTTRIWLYEDLGLVWRST
jgi:hypothetical protein